jgi:hypothetical protein
MKENKKELYDNFSAYSLMGSMSLFGDHSDSARLVMLNTHIVQAEDLINGEMPLINNIHTPALLVGDAFVQAQTKTEIKKKFDLFEGEIVLVHDLENNIVDYYTINENLSGFGSITKVKEEGNILERGDIIFENETQNGYLKMGTMANVALKIHTGTFEDQMIISKSFADKAMHLERNNYDIHVKPDTEFINTINDAKTFKPIPDVADGVILTTRKRTELNFLSFTNDALNKVSALDDYKRYEGYGNIKYKIYMNQNMKDIPKTRTWDWLNEQHNDNIKYHEEFIHYIEGLISKTSTLLSPNLYNLVNYYKEFVNGFEVFEKKPLSCVIRIRTENMVKTVEGSKFTNMHGTKGLIKIAEVFDMPYTFEKNLYNDEMKRVPIDIIINVDTAVGRANLGQIREMEMNSVIRKYDDKIKFELFMFNSLKETDEKTANKHFKEAVDLFKHFMLICNINIKYPPGYFTKLFDEHFQLCAFAEKINIKLLEEEKPNIHTKLYNPKTGKPYKNDCVVGEKYIFKLKHESYKKASACALPYENVQSEPTRSSKKDYKKIGDKPSKLSYMETDHLATLGTEILTELGKLRSASKTGREALTLELLTKDEIPSLKKFNVKRYNNNHKDHFTQITQCLGIDINI